MSSQNEFCRDYCGDRSLHVWLSFQHPSTPHPPKKKKKSLPFLPSESISRLQRHSSLEVAGPLRLTAHPQAVPFRVGAEGGWHTNRNTLSFTSTFVLKALHMVFPFFFAALPCRQSHLPSLRRVLTTFNYDSPVLFSLSSAPHPYATAHQKKNQTNRKKTGLLRDNASRAS